MISDLLLVIAIGGSFTVFILSTLLIGGRR